MTLRHARRMSVLPLLLVASMVVASPGAAQELRWGGEWQAGGIATVTDTATDVTLSGLLRLQAHLPAETWRLAFEGHAGVDGPLTSTDEWETHGEVDRLFVRLYLPAADVTLGKQAINWGVGARWSPTDLFSPPDSADLTAIRPGVVAAEVRIPAGPLGYWSLAASQELYGVRRRGNVQGTDWGWIVASEAGEPIVGADAKGDWRIGWHAAGTCRIPGGGGDPVLEGLVGADYSWLEGDLAWLGEYHVTAIPTAGTPAAQETYHQLTYRLDEFTSLAGAVQVDLHQAGATWIAGVTTLLGQQSELTATVTVPSARDFPFPMEPPKAVVTVKLSQAF